MEVMTEPEVVVAVDLVPGPEAERQPQSEEALRKRKILIVDDDEELVKEITDILTMEGYDVAAFTSSVEAAHKVNEVMPDLALLDLRMNGQSGFELANRIAHRPETAHIPVIAMTGYYKEGTHDGLMQIVGIRAYLMKPFKPGALLEMIASLIP
jgi:CheY-like chemotaxis protein